MLSIEHSHFYQDQLLDRSSVASIKPLLNLHPQATSVVLIDDLAENPLWSLQDLLNVFAAEHLRIDGVFLESAFCDIAQEFYQILQIRGCVVQESFNRGQRKKAFFSTPFGRAFLGTWKNGHFQPACALLSCAWNACRLGYRAMPRDACVYGGIYPSAQIITVLPDPLIPVERRALHLLRQIFPDIMADRMVLRSASQPIVSA